jgi:hypothetical protein
MKLELLSPNLIHIINRLLFNEELKNDSDKQIISQLVKHDDVKPFSKPILTKEEAKNLFMDRVFPFPFDNYTEGARTEIRVYFPECEFKNGTIIEDTTIIFDIVTHKDIYLMRDKDNKTLLRPHEIAKYIVRAFDTYTFKDTVGRLKFDALVNVPFDNGFQCTRLVARMTTFSKD